MPDPWVHTKNREILSNIEFVYVLLGAESMRYTHEKIEELLKKRACKCQSRRGRNILSICGSSPTNYESFYKVF